jgi:gamma-glutamyltranspeptidase/glutathione hydrolase
MGHLSADQLHYYIEAQRLAYADRNRYVADPAFTKVPISGLIDKAYAKEQRARISFDKDLGVVQPGNPNRYESGSTTSFSVVGKNGNMITVSQTINAYFGAGVVPEGTGILLNDEMADFVPDPSSVNAPGPGKRPLSSITPTLLLKDGKPFATLAIGMAVAPMASVSAPCGPGRGRSRPTRARTSSWSDPPLAVDALAATLSTRQKL